VQRICERLLQDPKYMYISLDEACTHVDAPAFRLVAAVYDSAATRLLATAVSPPVRCATVGVAAACLQAFHLHSAQHQRCTVARQQRCLGPSASPSTTLPLVCSVLANNDVPTGAARIPLEAQLPPDWEGWAATPAKEVDVEAPPQQRLRRSRSARHDDKAEVGWV
jgi:hypothetical protein